MNLLEPFVLEDLGLRGAVVRLKETWREVKALHDYSEEVSAVLAEAVLAMVLLTAGLKRRTATTLQLRSNGRISLLIVQTSADLKVRGLASSTALRPSLFGEGQLAVTLDPETGERYQGIVPVAADSLRVSLEEYFANSEQLATRLWFDGSAGQLAGVLVQALPSSNQAGNQGMVEPRRGVAELGRLGTADWLRAAFPETQIRLFEGSPVRHDCRCNAGHLGRLVRLLGETEVRAALADRGDLEITCEFCNRVFSYSESDATAMLAGADAPEATVH